MWKFSFNNTEIQRKRQYENLMTTESYQMEWYILLTHPILIARAVK
jgi:hypothetical protein